MEYVGYKKLHRRNTRNTRIQLVEWPGGGFTLGIMGKMAKGVWSGGSLRMTDASAKWLKGILGRALGRRSRR